MSERKPTPGTEGYWSEIDQYTPERGDLARIISLDSAPAVYVLEADHTEDIAEVVPLAYLERERVELLLDGDDKQRRGLVAPIQTSLENADVSTYPVPRDDLGPLAGGEEQ